MPVFDEDDLIDNDDKEILRYYFNNKDFKKFVDEREHWMENLITYWQAYKIYEKKKIKKDRVIKFCWITIQDFQRRIGDIDKLLTFINKIGYLYESGHWIIEAGKCKDINKSNIHIHMLVKIINEKNHKKQLCIEWSRLFDTNLRDKDYYKLKQHRDCKGMPSYKQWCDEKLSYFNNDEKVDGHSNCFDLNLRGEFGGEGVPD